MTSKEIEKQKTHPHIMSHLPTDVYVSISTFLHYKDLVYLSLSCKGLYEAISKGNSIWKSLVNRLWSWIPIDINNYNDFQHAVTQIKGSNQKFTLSIISCSAENYGDYYCKENVLEEDSKVYCTKLGYNLNVSMVFNILNVPDGAVAFVKEFVLVAPGSGYSAPIKDSIVFLSQEQPDPNLQIDTDNMTLSYFEEQLATHPADRKIKFMPDAFLSCPQRGRLRYTFKEPLPARFIHLKMLNAYGRDNNIDISGFFVYGTILNPMGDQKT